MSIPIRAIRIVDSCGVTVEWTSKTQAARYVEQGRAVYSKTGSSIRFTDQHHAHQAAVMSKLEYDRSVNGPRAITRRELQAIPFVGRIDNLLGVGKQRRKGAARAAA